MHIFALIAFIGVQKPRRHVWGKRFVQFLGKAEMQPGLKREWSASVE